MSKLKKSLAKLGLGLGLSLAFLIFLEGLASVWYALSRATPPAKEPTREKGASTQYDAELGWSHIPGISVPGMFGPGTEVHINDQGLRALVPRYPEGVRPGQIRLLCSGDSFTFGYGVSDQDTWVNRLQGLDPRLETINMGQIGYGLDQVYLWYLRDGVKFSHQVHLVSFITADFHRMGSGQFLGYEKPYLELDDAGGLQVRNVPVPRHWLQAPEWLTGTAKRLEDLRLVQLLREGAKRLLPKEDPYAKQRDILKLALAIFADLERIDRAKGSTLVLVYLPIVVDLGSEGSTFWRSELRQKAAASGWVFLDLVEEARRQNWDRPRFQRFFRPDGHFSVEGNAVMARLIYDRLKELPALRAAR